MKVTNLMVGDWVQSKPNGNVKWQWEDVNFIHLNDYEIEPILLTEDILKANNIPHQQSLLHGVEWVRNLGDKGFEMTLDTNDFAINADIKFVHQLQHALRLVGLNEVADNFKIK